MSTVPQNAPYGPAGVSPNPPTVHEGPEVLRQQYVSQTGYNMDWTLILSPIVDELEQEIGPETFTRMSRDPKIHKSRRIRVNGVLTDDLQLAPGRNAEEVGEGEYKRYEQFAQFAERMIASLECPLWRTLEQMLVGGWEQGHKIAETMWDYKLDTPFKGPDKKKKQIGPTAPPPPKPEPRPAARSLISRFTGIFAAGPKTDPNEKNAPVRRGSSIFNSPKVMLMPTAIKVRPRGSVLFAVDQYMNTLGLVPAWRTYPGTLGRASLSSYSAQDIITRDKFMVYVNNPEDDDPRGHSAYIPLYNWWNFKVQLPKQYLKQCIQEGMPIPILTMPERMDNWIQARDKDGNPLYEDDLKLRPKFVTANEAARIVIENMHNGKGVSIPYGATLAPYVGNKSGARSVLSMAINDADKQIEEGFLNQSLAQSEGEHQARAASMTHEGRLNDLFFWDKRILCTMLLHEFIAVGFRMNFGDWALEYMPKLSLGDSEKRNWAEDLATVAQAYFWGFIDDTQRPELMAWLSLPRPGPSRQEQMAELGMQPNAPGQAQPDVNGNPAVPNNNRPDKKPGNAGRNDGNGTPKKAPAGRPKQGDPEWDMFMENQMREIRERVENAKASKSGVFALGHHSRRGGGFVEYLSGSSH